MVDQRIYQVKNYQLLEEVSRGGMGVVYKARDVNTNKIYALKFMLPGSDEESQKRFLREAKALSMVRHPNVVSILQYGQDNGLPFIVMELIEGESLSKLVQATLRSSGEAPSYSWTISIFKQIAEGLKACHDQGLCHRDIKPDNILIENGSQNPKLIDFGLVKMDPSHGRLDSLSTLTKSGDFLGTPYFMSPEQFDPKECGELGLPSDIWSLGTTLFYCLTGKPPYEGEALVNIYSKIVVGEPPTVSSVNNKVPERLVTLCSLCMRKDASQRITAEEIIELLESNESRNPLVKPILAGTILMAMGLLLTMLVVNFQDPEPISFIANKSRAKVNKKAPPTNFVEQEEISIKAIRDRAKLIEGESAFILDLGLERLGQTQKKGVAQGADAQSKFKLYAAKIETHCETWRSLLRYVASRKKKSDAKAALQEQLSRVYKTDRIFMLRWLDQDLFENLIKLGQTFRLQDRTTLKVRQLQIDFERAQTLERTTQIYSQLKPQWASLLEKFSRVGKRNSEELRSLRQLVFELALVKVRCEKTLSLDAEAYKTLESLTEEPVEKGVRILSGYLQDKLTSRELATVKMEVSIFNLDKFNKEQLKDTIARLTELAKDEAGKHRPYAYPRLITATLKYIQLLSVKEKRTYLKALSLKEFEESLYWDLTTAFYGRTKPANLIFFPSYVSAAKDLAELLSLKGDSRSAVQLLSFTKELLQRYRHPRIVENRKEIEAALSKLSR